MGNDNKKLKDNLISLYNDTISFCNKILTFLNKIEADNKNQFVYKQIILQFFLINKQNLESIFFLIKNGQYYTAQTLLRNLLEYLITLEYIRLEPEVNSRKYSFNGFRNNLRILRDEFFPIENRDELIEKLEQKLSEITNEESKWPNLIDRAKLANLGELYAIGYRYLSKFTHPDSNNSDDFFEERNGTLIFYDFKESNKKRTLILALNYFTYFIDILLENFSIEIDGYDDLKRRILQTKL